MCSVHPEQCSCCGFKVVRFCIGNSIPTLTSTEIRAKSAFLNKESVQKEVKATLSQKATLSCEVADNKTEVKWYKDGKLLSPSRTVHSESKGKTRQLVMDSIEKKDAGEYICEVGTEKLAFKVLVTGMRTLKGMVCVRGI
uniref:Ig-like domain-containing protein n=1 Tax=Seriola lalandi dorsalis TaxID=1841481 RepID=A0A3B4X563_SERLL